MIASWLLLKLLPIFTFSTLLCFEVIADAYPLCQSKLERALESPKAVTPCRAS